uniref:Actin-binding cytoskeleton protein filamin n=1 Tax=Romanomermis culicivorax TaxID=13658 RepID=A0A915KZQ5_ROMCU
DASEAGVGNLEVAVNEGDISSTAKSLGQHRYEITFIPRQIVDHVISVKFNGETVPGSPFICQIVSANEIDAKGPGLGKVAVNRLTNFTVDTKYSSHVPPTVTIKDPIDSDLPVKISAIYENNFRVEYTPQVVGSHTIDVRYNNEPIKDSPFTVKAYDAQSVKLLPVQGSVVGEPASFFSKLDGHFNRKGKPSGLTYRCLVDATRAGAGNMEIIVSVENRNVPNFVKHEQNARFTVSFKPQEPKPHVISVKFNGEHVPGSPMTTTPFLPSESVAGAPPVTNEGVQQAFVGTPVSFFVRAKFPGAECNVDVTDPNGGAVPVRCYQQKDGNYRVECTPAVAGEHKVEIGFGDGRPEKVIFVKCFDPSALKLLGDLKSAQLNQESSYRVNRRDTGKGQLSAYLLDRASGVKSPADVQSVSENEDEIRFVPRSLGQHELHLMLDGVEISDPVSFVVEDPGKPAAHGDGLQKSLLNEPAYFVVENRKNKGDIKVEVLNPHGKSIKVAKSKKGDGVTEFSYTPTETGYYNAIVLWNNKPLLGSPFNVTVLDPRNVILKEILPQGADKRQLSPATVGSRKELKFDTTAAGPGKLRCETRGPTGYVPTTCTESSAGQYTVSFTPNVQ